MQEEMIQSKWIKIYDIGRRLNPIGYGYNSPIYRPTKLPIETIHRLLSESRVTNMTEVFEKDKKTEVKLTIENFRDSFQSIWEKENPGKQFPWANDVVSVGQTEVEAVKAETVEPQKVSDPTPPVVETPVNVEEEVKEEVSEVPVVEEVAETPEVQEEKEIGETPEVPVVEEVVETPENQDQVTDEKENDEIIEAEESSNKSSTKPRKKNR